MAITEAHANLWSVLVGRGPQGPFPADVDVWQRVRDGLNPARARPRLRDGVEFVELTSLRSGPYVMARSPDPRDCAYARLTTDEAGLAQRMNGEKTVAQLVGEFATMTGRLAPDQVQRIVADLAGGRMLDELPIDAFERVRRIRRRPWPLRLGAAILRGATGRRMVIANPDRAVSIAYQFGGRLLFTRIGGALMALTAIAGLGLFARSYGGGGHSAFLFQDSYLAGALLVLGLNVLGLLFHEVGHALGAKHGGRRVPAVGFLCFFGMPSAFVDTTDMWMANRKHRLVASAAGPAFALTFAGAAQVAGLFFPALAPIAFKLGFAWYLNTLFNLNPLMTLDGYYLLMDWLEIPGLRAKGMAFTVAAVRRPRVLFRKRAGEARLVAFYAAASALWTLVMLGMLYGMFQQRYVSMGLVLWNTGWPARLFMVSFAFLLASPLVFLVGRWARRLPGRVLARWRRRDHEADFPRRVTELRRSKLGSLPEEALAELARDATWLLPRRGSEVAAAGAPLPGAIVVANGALEGRLPGDPSGHVRTRAGEGEVVGMAPVLSGAPSSLQWTAVGTRLLVIPSAVFTRVVGPLVRKPPPADQTELETLLDEIQAFAGLSDEARLGLVSRARPTDVPPGQRFRVKEGFAALVGSGVVELPGSVEVRRGGLIGPPAGEAIDAEARTRARVWSLAAVGGLAPFLGAAAERQTQLVSHVAPGGDAHGDGASAQFVLPWGSPPPDPAVADAADERLAVAFRGILAGLGLVALLALLFAGRSGDAWAEIPGDTAVLEVDRGTVRAVVDGVSRVLEEGDQVVVGETDDIDVGRRSLARLTYRGDGEVVLCPTSDVTLDRIETHGLDPLEPETALTQRAGKLIVDTEPVGSDFAPVTVAVTLALDPDAEPPVSALVENDGEAEFSTSLAEVEVAEGDVTLDGDALSADPGPLACGTGGQGRPLRSTAETTTTTIAAAVDAAESTTTTARAPTTTTSKKKVTGGSTPVTTVTTTPPVDASTTTTPPTTTPPTTTPPTTSPPATTTTAPPVTTTTCYHC